MTNPMAYSQCETMYSQFHPKPSSIALLKRLTAGRGTVEATELTVCARHTTSSHLLWHVIMEMLL